MQDNQSQAHWGYITINGVRPSRPNSKPLGLSKEELVRREESYQKMREFNGKQAGAETKSHGHESACDSPSL
jgi:hypothetical protein